MFDPENSPIGAVSERDIDLLLLEEMHTSAEFVRWLIEKTFGTSEGSAEFVSAHHSIVDDDGESDLLLVFKEASGARCALLIEDKINAPPQPEQADRYRLRAEAGKGDGHWSRWKTAIIAPQEYLRSGKHDYDAQISYEDIAQWYESSASSTPRSAYRARVMRDAIARARRTGPTRVDEVMTALWRSYWADAMLLYPELEMRQPGPKAPSSNWIQFRPARLETGRALIHKFPRGCVDLQLTDLSSTRLAEFRNRWNSVLSSQDLTVEQTSASLSVRAIVPPMIPGDDYSTQQTQARAGMKAAYRLLYVSPLLPVRDEPPSERRD
jgi:hypothetical protein